MALNQALKYKNIPNHLRIKNFDSSFLHHEVTKLVLMTLLKRNNPKAEVFSEYQLPNGDFPDVAIVYPNGDLCLFEVQKEICNSWEKMIKKRDAELTLEINQSIDTIIIPLKLMPENIYELESKLKEFI